MNPLLRRDTFIPDPEAHKMPDGRLYLYGSLDISGRQEYCSKNYRVFSTDDERLENWVDHGIVFSNTAENPQLYWNPDYRLSAPDAIYKDGKYYLFFCSHSSRGGLEGVAVSDTPYGPFSHAKPVIGANEDGIDPAVFVDDDGSAYLFWGQFHLRGGKLNDDMCSLDENTVNKFILTEEEHGFHEGASIRKRDGKYYLVYVDISGGRATALSYAIADQPLGPYQKVGKIIDNMYCDPQTWNNHGSIEEYKGQWYVFYHRSSQNGIYSRRTCVEKIYFDENGKILPVEMTSQGASGPINPYEKVDASIACRMKGKGYITPDKVGLNGEILTHFGGGNWIKDWAEYKYFNFERGTTKFYIHLRGEGKVQITTSDGVVLGSCDIHSKEFQTLSCEVENITGIKPIWLLFYGTNIDIAYFWFE